MKRSLTAITVIVLIFSLFTSQAFAESFTVIDQAGREVTFDAPAERIVSCYYISTSTIIALGNEDKLVGIEKKADERVLYQLAAPEIVSLPAVGSGKGVNVEEIAALDPDVVILPIKLKDDADVLADLGINVILVNPESEEQFAECVTLLGKVTGAEDKAVSLLEHYDYITMLVDGATEGLEAPAVYMASGSDLYTTYPSGIYQHDLITTAGGRNVAEGMTGNGKVTIDAEQLIAWNPDYIFIVADAEYTVEDVINDPQLADIAAVKNGNVFRFPSAIEAWDYPTASSCLGKAYLACTIHPDNLNYDGFASLAVDFYKVFFSIDLTIDDIIK